VNPNHLVDGLAPLEDDLPGHVDLAVEVNENLADKAFLSLVISRFVLEVPLH